jgi:uncharacterized zinc-type alcohol dehydrogenase-like protein
MNINYKYLFFYTMENNYGIPECRDDEFRDIAWGIPGKGQPCAPMWINRPKPDVKDIKMEVLFVGLCHSDNLIGKDMFKMNQWPFIPGHEFIGRVVEVGGEVTKVKVGDHVGVGCFVDKCDTCEGCLDKEEAYCSNKVQSVCAKKIGRRTRGNQETFTQGGYSQHHVIHEDFAFVIPEGMNMAEASPILCAGITVYSPLKHWGCLDGKKMTVGVCGIGGLGTMAIKMAKAMGHDVMAISTTVAKEPLARAKGAVHFCASTDPESIKANAGKCNLIINTVAADHNVNVYLPLLHRDGVIVQLGLTMQAHPIIQIPLMRNRWSIAGSVVGSLAEHQEVIDFCFKHNVSSDVTLVEAKDIDSAWEQLEGKNKDALRYVLDIKKSLANPDFLPK